VVHERVRWPSDEPGAWHLPSDATDDYGKQIISEARRQSRREAVMGFMFDDLDTAAKGRRELKPPQRPGRKR